MGIKPLFYKGDMMREIKFRAWDIAEQEMHYSDRHEEGGCDGGPIVWEITGQGIRFMEQRIIAADEVVAYVAPKQKVMQYIGLKSNGTKIFESDILTPHNLRKATGKDWEAYKVEVVSYKGMFCLKPNKKFIDKYGPLYKSLDRALKAKNGYVIIGNIYENPELLKD